MPRLVGLHDFLRTVSQPAAYIAGKAVSPKRSRVKFDFDPRVSEVDPFKYVVNSGN